MSKQEAEKFLGGSAGPEKREWFVQIIKADSLPPDVEVTAVAIVACLGDKIIFIRNSRGWDIPGGHVEETDKTIEQTAKRELLEETCAESVEFKLVGYMLSDFYPDRKTCIAIQRAEVVSLNEFIPQHETIERRLMSPKKCRELYYGNPALIEKLLKVALG